MTIKIRLLISAGIFLAALLALWLLNNPETAGRVVTKTLKLHRNGALIIKSEDKAFLNQPIEVRIDMDTKGVNVNAVGVYLRYDPQKLQLLDMDTRGSFCQFYPEKRFDNQLGSISLACGSPHPGVSGLSNIMLLKFMPLQLGETYIRADDQSQILVSDGKGTNIIEEYPNNKITITNRL